MSTWKIIKHIWQNKITSDAMNSEPKWMENLTKQMKLILMFRSLNAFAADAFFSSCAIHKRNNLFSADISWKATERGKNLQSYIVTADFISRASTTSPGSTFEENFLFTVFVFFVVVPISPGKWKVMQKIFDELSITSGAIAPLLIAFSVFTESSVNRWNWGII